MHYSGLLVTCKPDDLDACVKDLARMSGVDVYATEEETGRIVVVVDTDSVAAQESTFAGIQNLPRVIAAELVYHYFGEEAAQADPESVLERNTSPRTDENNPGTRDARVN